MHNLRVFSKALFPRSTEICIFMLKFVGRTFETRHQKDLIDFGQTYALREAKVQGRNIHDNGPGFSGMIPSVED
jgi:hypothetical protein